MAISIGKEYRFEAAHQLPYHRGQCRHLHGHSYKLIVEVRGAVNLINKGDPQSGMVIDYAMLDEIVDLVVSELDHTFLNDTLPYPTVENILQHIWRLLKPEVTILGVELSRLRLYETERAYAEINEV